MGCGALRTIRKTYVLWPRRDGHRYSSLPAARQGQVLGLGPIMLRYSTVLVRITVSGLAARSGQRVSENRRHTLRCRAGGIEKEVRPVLRLSGRKHRGSLNPHLSESTLSSASLSPTSVFIAAITVVQDAFRCARRLVAGRAGPGLAKAIGEEADRIRFLRRLCIQCAVRLSFECACSQERRRADRVAAKGADDRTPGFPSPA